MGGRAPTSLAPFHQEPPAHTIRLSSTKYGARFNCDVLEDSAVLKEKPRTSSFSQILSPPHNSLSQIQAAAVAVSSLYSSGRPELIAALAVALSSSSVRSFGSIAGCTSTAILCLLFGQEEWRTIVYIQFERRKCLRLGNTI